MDPELRDLLRTVAADSTSSNESHTHVTLYGPHARWTIPPQNLAKFWGGYCDLIYNKEQQGEELADICLAERPVPNMPVIANMIFRFDMEGDAWEPYDDVFILQVCYYYQKALSENFCFQLENALELVTIVMESKNHWYETDPKTGAKQLALEVRIQFPYCKIDVGLQNRLLRPAVINLLRNNNVIGRMQKTPIGDWDQIISYRSVDDHTVIYGSTEVAGRPKLQMTHMWPIIHSDLIECGPPPYEHPIEDVFVLKNHTLFIQQPTQIISFLDKPISYYIPMLLSINYWSSIVKPKPEVAATTDNGRFQNTTPVLNKSSNVKTFGNNSTKTYSIGDDNEAIELAENMVSMLSTDRFIKEAFWTEIGKALYHSNEGSENGLLSWIRHTLKALNIIQITPDFMISSMDIPLNNEERDEVVKDTCRNLYYTFDNSYITVNTLAWYAREDAPEKYGNWHRDWCMTSMEKALSCLHTDVAVAFHKVYWLDFAYCPVGRGVWFNFKKHRWHEINQGIEVRKTMSGDFVRRFEIIRSHVATTVASTTDENAKAPLEVTLKKLSLLIQKLKSVAFKSCLLTESTEHFTNDRFLSLLNANIQLTGVTNGVLECVGDYVMHRSAKPEDYVSMCTNVPYHTDYTWSHPLVVECMKWMGEVFTDEPLKHHFLKFSASCLRGSNSDKIFPILSGNGHNSKSMIIKLFESVFNSYCIKFPVSLLTEKGGNSSGPTPQLARAKGARVAFLDEPEDDVPMAKGTIKRFTGGDSFFARLLQENGGDIKATFKMILVCNNIPLIPNADAAIKDRAKIFPFLSKWIDNPPESYEEQIAQRLFKKNKVFDSRIPILAPAFLWIMGNYYPFYVKEGLVDPEIVTETTEKYWKENDVYAQFAADSVQEVYALTGERDAAARVTLSEIYTEFKEWFKQSFPGTKIPSRSDVRSELTSRWGRMHGTAWHGIRITTGEAQPDMGASLRPTIIAPPVKSGLVRNSPGLRVKPQFTPEKTVKELLVKSPVRSPPYGTVQI